MGWRQQFVLLGILATLLGMRGEEAAPDDGDPIDFLHYESRLMGYLTDASKYNRHVRPAPSASEPVHLQLGLKLIDLVEINEQKGFIAGKYWVQHMWTDQRLAWDPAEYGGVQSLRIPISALWRPDITLYNSARVDSQTIEFDALAIVYPSGYVLYIPATVFESQCAFDMRRFPFDTQHCHLKIGSWTYSGMELDVTLADMRNPLSLEHFVYHHEWDVHSANGTRAVDYYECCPEPYPSITFNLTLQRRAAFYQRLHILPAAVTALLVPCTFLLPAGHTHRYTLGIGLMITLAIMMSDFEWTFPTLEGGTPLLAQFYTTLQVTVCVALLLSVLVTNMADKGARGLRPPPMLYGVIVLGLGRLLCISSKRPPHANMSTMHNIDSGDDTSVAEMEKELMSDGPPQDSEWMLMGRVIDRLCFFVFLVIYVITAIVYTAH